MAKLTLNNIGSRYGSIDALNDNSDLIEAALENTLSRDGTGPNNMEADLDMDSNSILNADTVFADKLRTDELYINNNLVVPAQLAQATNANVVQYTPAGTGAVATTLQAKLRETVSVKDFGAVGDGVADDTAAINAALAASNSVYAPPGTFLTTGNHTITTQTFAGAGRTATIFKRSSSTNNVFLVMGDGQLQNLTVDGDNTWGNGVVVNTTTFGQLKPSVVDTIAVKNIGATAASISITAISNAAQCQITAASHGLVAGDYVDIKNVTGLVSTNNPTKSVVSGLWKVQTATTNTFTIDLDTTNWTAYISN